MKAGKVRTPRQLAERYIERHGLEQVAPPDGWPTELPIAAAPWPVVYVKSAPWAGITSRAEGWIGLSLDGGSATLRLALAHEFAHASLVNYRPRRMTDRQEESVVERIAETLVALPWWPR